MRTTFTLDDDVAAEVSRLRREDGIGISEAVNRLIRRGLASPAAPRSYRHRSADWGPSLELGNLVPDAMLAALALEHGLTVISADTDFARFPDVAWINPLAG